MWPKSRNHARTRRGQRGAGLIEVLVAVLVLSIGILGIAGLQARALKNNQGAFDRSQAVMLSYFMLDAMRVNAEQAKAGAYDLSKTCTALNDGSTLISNDQEAWIQALKAELGDRDSTCGEITCDSASCTVRVYWEDRNLKGDERFQMIETTTRL
ncbi:type IV pilus modification protein PilV [Schlegelella aquatica]|uniref:type IV pilus modification protein PilV n=1 Tax=Caldimonas aquatica TaxID=376175 RepID=UPI0037524649